MKERVRIRDLRIGIVVNIYCKLLVCSFNSLVLLKKINEEFIVIWGDCF